MSKRTRPLVALLVGAAVCYGGYKMVSSDDDADGSASPKLMVNHVWVDRMPNDERDMVRFFVPVRQRRNRVGAAGRASGWRQLADGFVWGLEGDRMSMYFGQEDMKWNAKVKAWRCDKANFDLCLVLSDGNRAIHLYSRDAWEIDPGSETAPAALEQDAPAVAAEVLDALQAASDRDDDKDVEVSDDETPAPTWAAGF